MKTTRIVQVTACAALLACAFGSHAQQTVYKWVDKDGKVQFSDSPPPADATATRKMGSGAVTRPGAICHADRGEALSHNALQRRRGALRPGRPPRKRGVPFSEKNAKVARRVKAMALRR
jgi:hypothetical protein